MPRKKSDKPSPDEVQPEAATEVDNNETAPDPHLKTRRKSVRKIRKKSKPSYDEERKETENSEEKKDKVPNPHLQRRKSRKPTDKNTPDDNVQKGPEKEGKNQEKDHNPPLKKNRRISDKASPDEVPKETDDNRKGLNPQLNKIKRISLKHIKKGRRQTEGSEVKVPQDEVKEKPNENEVTALFPSLEDLELRRHYKDLFPPDKEGSKESLICECDEREPSLQDIPSFDVRSALQDDLQSQPETHVAELSTNKCPVCQKGKFVRKDSFRGWLACVLCFPLGGPIWCRKACSNYICDSCGVSKY